MYLIGLLWLDHCQSSNKYLRIKGKGKRNYKPEPPPTTGKRKRGNKFGTAN
jgi:hypothetical protein